jgi:hypothetical protein
LAIAIIKDKEMNQLRKIRCLLFFLATIFISCKLCFGQDTLRDPLKWPFKSTSIWNMPIGSKARYIQAGIESAMQMGMTVDEDIIILCPNESSTIIYTNFADWDGSKDRCSKDGPFLFSGPIPDTFIVNKTNWDGNTPNSSAAILMSDGITIKQTQPFSRCTEKGDATSHYIFSDQNIYGDGYYGAHGGSGLSAIGGTLRLGELMPNSGPLRHALKVNLFGARNYYFDNITKGFRWPAKIADGNASTNYGTARSKPIVKECRMGALLALPAWIKIDSLNFETIPAKMLAEAFQNYGAYIVDDAGWDVYAIETEWSPDGRYITDFEKYWSFSFISSNKNNPWARDMDKIFLNLNVVDNNNLDSLGGGGVPRMPFAPDFIPTSIREGGDIINKKDFKLFQNFPNPFNPSTVIKYELSKKAFVSIKLYDLLGREIEILVNEEKSAGTYSYNLNISNLSNGVYFYRIIVENTSQINKMVLLK